MKSPGALAHLAHLDVPRQESPGPSGGKANSDFAAGYSLGLIGGVRSWVSSYMSQNSQGQITNRQLR